MENGSDTGSYGNQPTQDMKAVSRKFRYLVQRKVKVDGLQTHTLSHSHFKVGMVEPNGELQKKTNETKGEN